MFYHFVICMKVYMYLWRKMVACNSTHIDWIRTGSPPNIYLYVWKKYILIGTGSQFDFEHGADVRNFPQTTRSTGGWWWQKQKRYKFFLRFIRRGMKIETNFTGNGIHDGPLMDGQAYMIFRGRRVVRISEGRYRNMI